MKNNYNPYTVPEHFFEDTCNNAISRRNRRIRTINYSFVATIIAAVLVFVPAYLATSKKQIAEKEIAANNLAQMYEYDIFLQVNF